jgi:hypothetical protein
MRSSSDRDEAGAKPLIDTPFEGLAEWDSPFRHSFVSGSGWAPWLVTARTPPGPPAAAPAPAALPALSVQPPEPPALSAGGQEYAQYRRDYEARLDEAYADWKRSLFVSLFEPWIVDRRAAEALKKLRLGAHHGGT